MRAAAPGKLVVTGAYAVLEGSPAIVFAIDRLAIADTATTTDHPTAEVRAALGDRPAPSFDASALEDQGTKLGLGSSAAVLVATLGALALDEGKDLRDVAVRQELFDVARRAHRSAQGGGSGVDVAASVWGGVLAYAMGAPPRPVQLPEGLVWEAFYCGASTRTSDLRALVDAADPTRRGRAMAQLSSAARAAERALELGAGAFVAAAMETGEALIALGSAARAPIVTAPVRDLTSRARSEGAAFLPSGAGGGDVAVWVGLARPSEAFLAAVTKRGLRPLGLALDEQGLRALSSATPTASPSPSSSHEPKES